MQQYNHHDTSTQAMTEVALGLSMAFFSLLILALFSIGLPDKVQTEQAALPSTEQLTLAANNKQSQASQTPTSDQQQYVFYFQGQFYDVQLNPLAIEDFSRFTDEHPLILAVQDSLPLLEVMQLREQIQHPTLSITMLNQNWLTQLKKMP